MNGLGYLFAAYTIVWFALLAYLVFIAGSVGSLRKDIQVLRDILDERDSTPGSTATVRDRPGGREHEAFPG